MSKKINLTSFVNSNESAEELATIIDAYKYHIMYGIRVPMTTWSKRQIQLFKELTNEDEE